MEGRPPVRLAKGSHIVVRKLFDHDSGYIFQNTDKRIVFALPFAEDFTLIGTTDENFAGALDAVAPSGDEVLYLCRAVNEFFREPIGPEHVVWAFAGVRALYDDEQGQGRAEDVTRDYHLELDERYGAAPVLTVYGGKITTYRRLAEDALGKLVAFLPVAPALDREDAAAGRRFSLGRDRDARGADACGPGRSSTRPRRGGSSAPMARGSIACMGDAKRREDVAPWFGPLSAAEVRYLMKHEWARAAGRRAVAAEQARADAEQGRKGRAGAVHGTMRGTIFAAMTHLIAIDQGTTSTRAIVFDASLAPVAIAQQELRQIYPAPGWVEHDPEEIWAAVVATVRDAMAKAGVGAKDIAGIGITNQRETTIVWDRVNGKPIHNAIVWQDRRTADACAALRAAGHEAAVADKTGLVLDPYFSATKIGWLLDHVNGRARRPSRAGLPSARWIRSCSGG